jgi:regulatory protein
METDKIRARARNNAYALLRIRPRSEREIRDRLKLKGYGAEHIEDIVAGLKKIGDIDDLRFARLWLESRMHSNPVGDVVLKHELQAKGVSDAIIADTLQYKSENYDEYEIALSMAGERFQRLKRLDRHKAGKRLYDFLLRRGFTYDNVKRVVESVVKKGDV